MICPYLKYHDGTDVTFGEKVWRVATATQDVSPEIATHQNNTSETEYFKSEQEAKAFSNSIGDANCFLVNGTLFKGNLFEIRTDYNNTDKTLSWMDWLIHRGYKINTNA